jgi:hypothetical protein
MTVQEFIEKAKTDKKILLPFIFLILLVFVFTYKIVSSFSSDEVSNESVTLSAKSLIPEDSITNVENHTKLSSYEKNKKQNINNTAGLNSMIDGLIDEQEKPISDTMSNLIPVDDNSNIVNDRTLSFKEKLLAKKNAYQNRSNGTSSNATKSSHKSSSSSSHKASKKEIVKEVEVPKEPARRTKNVTSNYGSLFNGETESNLQNHIKAEIHNEGRKVKPGSYVKVRLSEDLILKDGTVIPKNTIVTSVCDFGNQRVYLKVTNILFNGKRHDVKLQGYGLDGYRGLYDENVIDKEIAQSAMDEAVTSGSKDVNLPIIGNISLDILKKKMKEQHTILREGEHINLEFSKN